MIYLDNAATTLKKPSAVYKSSLWALKHLTTPGRGTHSAAMQAAEISFQCREKAAQLFHVPNPENVIFTANATHGLNIAIKSIARKGDRVVISGYEHNSVTRPLHAIGARTIVAASELFEPEMAVHAFESRLMDDTALVVLNHVSNVFGYILPAERIAQICREREIPFILDASQSAGTVPIDFLAIGAAFVAMPGHKGLYGPQGTGLLLCANRAEPLLEGGTGSNSISQEMPEYFPDRLETGTHNMPGIAGLLSGMEYVEKIGIDHIMDQERTLIQLARDGLTKINCVHVFSKEDVCFQSGVLSFIINGVPCERVGEELSKYGIASRVGLHCSPLAHKTADTLRTGTIRISVSAFTTKKEIYTFLNVISDISEKWCV